MNITYQQKKWLDDRGGRTAADVMGDSKGLYALMGGGGGVDQKVYLPKGGQSEEV